MPDLWPEDFGKLDITPPVATLKEQADLIGKKTRGQVIGRVRTTKDGSFFVQQMSVVAPALDDYTYRVLSAKHAIDLYPLDVFSDVFPTSMRCESHPQFVDVVRTILASDKVKNVIRAMMAQADALTENATTVY